MCHFLSALVTKTGRVLWNEYTDSHEDLIAIHGLKDDKPPMLKTFVRVEYLPGEGDAAYDPQSYSLHLDQCEAPDWWNEKLACRVASELQRVVKRMLLRKNALILTDGCYLVPEGIEIDKVINARIVRCGGTINAVCGGTINAVCGGTINAVWSGTINAIRGGTVNEVCGGTINAVWSGTINTVRGGTVNEVCGGTINAVSGGTINAVCGGTVNEVCGGTINAVWSGTINTVRGGTIVKDHRKKAPK